MLTKCLGFKASLGLMADFGACVPLGKLCSAEEITLSFTVQNNTEVTERLLAH